MPEEPQPAPSGESPVPPPLAGGPVNWKLSFGLFTGGFLLLVVTGKLGVSALVGNLLKGLGVVLCGGSFYLARRARRPKR